MSLREPSAREAAAVRVLCPTCEAPPGTWCYVTAGKRRDGSPGRHGFDRHSATYIHVRRFPKRT